MNSTIPSRIMHGVRVASAAVQEPVPGITTPLHLHPNLLHLGCVEYGSGICRYGEVTRRFAPGRVFVLYPGVPHVFQASRRNPYRAFFVHVEVLGALARDLPEVIRLTDRRAEIEDQFRRMHAISGSSYSSLKLVGMLALLYADLLDISRRTAQPDERLTSIPESSMHDLLERFQSQPFEFPGIDALAKQTCMSRRSFTTMFRRMTGQSPYQLFNRFRMEHALGILSDGEMDVTRAAHCCGFANAQSFIKAFKAQFGVSPLKHLKQDRKTTIVHE